MNALVARLVDHVEIVKASPSTPLDQGLFSELGRESVAQSLSLDAKLRLISSVGPLIPQLQQDPTPAANLLAILLRSDGLPPFSQLISLQPDAEIVAGLQSSLEALQLLTIGLLSRVETPADVWLIAGKREIVSQLIECWLTTVSTAVAEQSGVVLQDMLRLDGPVEDEGSLSSRDDHVNQVTITKPSSGLIWKRIFKDRDIYELIYACCSLETPNARGLTKARITTAQGRLLDLLAKVLYAPQIWESQMPDIERKFKVPAEGGILDFAMKTMVDYEDDVLMHIHLIEFFAGFLKSRAGIAFSLPIKRNQSFDADSSTALNLLISSGLHQRTAEYYLEPRQDDLFADYLYGPAGQYIEAYAQTYPAHFRKHMAERVIAKASTSLDSINRSAWAHQRAPVHELRLIASIPRQTILAVDSGAVVFSLPVKPPNAASFSALAHIFQGPSTQEAQLHDESPEFVKLEQGCARALFFLYTARHQDFWSDVVHAASSTASVEIATAAVRLIRAIVESSWARLPGSHANGVISEDELRAKCPSHRHLPDSGALVTMVEPALGQILPFLLRGPENRSPDAFTIAREKHEILPVLRTRLVEATAAIDEDERPAAWGEMLELLRHRQGLGVMGGMGQSIRVPNPEVGTMEL